MEKPAILVVEDDDDLRHVLVNFLEKDGFQPLEANSAMQGLNLAIERTPDLILLDILMPEMSGYQMLKRLRETNDWGKRVPVIFLTNVPIQNDAEFEDIQSTAPVDYIIKSDVDPEDVIKRIRKYLGQG